MSTSLLQMCNKDYKPQRKNSNLHGPSLPARDVGSHKSRELSKGKYTELLKFILNIASHASVLLCIQVGRAVLCQYPCHVCLLLGMASKFNLTATSNITFLLVCSI